MTNTLRSTITDLAATFASSILDAIRQMSLDEILAETHAGGRRGGPHGSAAAARSSDASDARGGHGRKRKVGRLERRSPSAIAALVGRIVGVLQSHPSGLRAEQIRDALGLESKELPRPLAEALDGRRISKTGQKRATTYFARGAGAKGGAGAAKGKAASKKSKRGGAAVSRKAKAGKRSARGGAASASTQAG